MPPRVHPAGNLSAMYPSETGGGTWIGVNAFGISLVLINWYSVSKRVATGAVTRGQVVTSVLPASSSEAVGRLLNELPLHRMHPFRLIGVFPSVRRVAEWQWNQDQMERLDHAWKTSAWFSSGFDEPGVQVMRGETFRSALQQQTAGTLEWLRRLHRSHSPERSAYSICMHRNDAKTVSYTEVLATRTTATMRYLPSCPCARSNIEWRRRSAPAIQLLL